MAFNEGWIDFERAGRGREGTVTLDTVIAGLIVREWQHDQHHSAISGKRTWNKWLSRLSLWLDR